MLNKRKKCYLEFPGLFYSYHTFTHAANNQYNPNQETSLYQVIRLTHNNSQHKSWVIHWLEYNQRLSFNAINIVVRQSVINIKQMNVLFNLKWAQVWDHCLISNLYLKFEHISQYLGTVAFQQNNTNNGMLLFTTVVNHTKTL